MRYELSTGWRYLHGGHRDHVMRRFAAIAAAIAIAGVIMIAAGASTVGVAVLVVGMVATAVFALLSTLSVFTSMSVLGIALGVAALTVVLAVTTGFQRQFRDKVLGINAHVMVRSAGGVTDYTEVMKIAKAIDPEVVAVQPFDYQEVVVTVGRGAGAGVAVKGIDPQLSRDVLELEQYIDEGSLDALGQPRRTGELPPIVIGRGLAHKLGAKLGEPLTVVIPFSNVDLRTWRVRSAEPPRTRRFRIAGIFYSGFEEYDKRLMFAALAETQALAGRGDQVLGVELKIENVERAGEIAAKLEQRLGPPYEAIGWNEMNAGLFDALATQKVVLVIILTLIILVASVNMVSAITMLVTDKTREIAILKSMGSTSTSVARVFRVVGVSMGLVGTTIGLAIGLVTCHAVGEHGFPLDPKVYVIDRLPVVTQPFDVVMVAVIAIAISWIATTIPARSAAALLPVDGLRYD